MYLWDWSLSISLFEKITNELGHYSGTEKSLDQQYSINGKSIFESNAGKTMRWIKRLTWVFPQLCFTLFLCNEEGWYVNLIIWCRNLLSNHSLGWWFMHLSCVCLIFIRWQLLSDFTSRIRMVHLLLLLWCMSILNTISGISEMWGLENCCDCIAVQIMPSSVEANVLHMWWAQSWCSRSALPTVVLVFITAEYKRAVSLTTKWIWVWLSTLYKVAVRAYTHNLR